MEMGIVEREEVVEKYLVIEDNLASDILSCDFSQSKVKFILNPLDYARQPHRVYLDQYLGSVKHVLFVGLNPGPWGMCQTGVPFGDVRQCREFLNISGHVTTPDSCPSKVKIKGFETTRREVSGERFWNFVKQKFVTADNFFKNCFVTNYCPLAFLRESGKNITPSEFSSDLRRLVYDYCDQALLETIHLLKCRIIVAVGKTAYDRLTKLKTVNNLEDLSLVYLMHPSPANPAANRDWGSSAHHTLAPLNLY